MTLRLMKWAQHIPRVMKLLEEEFLTFASLKFLARQEGSHPLLHLQFASVYSDTSTEHAVNKASY